MFDFRSHEREYLFAELDVKYFATVHLFIINLMRKATALQQNGLSTFDFHLTRASAFEIYRVKSHNNLKLRV